MGMGMVDCGEDEWLVSSHMDCWPKEIINGIMDGGFVSM